MERREIRILVVDDYEPWRRFLRWMLLVNTKLQIVGEADDGIEAIEKAKHLQPDLVLLDIGLPKLDGIKAAQQILDCAPNSKVLFVSENSSRDIVAAALGSGGTGYVIKSDSANELLAAVGAVLEGEEYLSASVASLYSAERTSEASRNKSHRRNEMVSVSSTPETIWAAKRHEVGFYSDDRGLLDALTQFVGAALSVGNSAIVIATESHRDSLLVRLQKYGLHIDAAVEHGQFIALDAAGALSTVMVDGKIDAVRFFAVFDDLIRKTVEAARAGQCRVAIFGECVHLLWARGNAEAAIQMETLGNQLAERYDADILCGYSLKSFQGGIGSHIFEQICAQHSAVHAW